MLTGPKSSGKSTFARILGNKLLSDSSASKGIAVLDLDPGQPEYSPPGQLSLLHIQEPNFGPPFSHPTTNGKNSTLRSHAIGAITPSQDSSLYMACALDLYNHYKNLLQKYPRTPLIINTSGWVLGTGLEILTELIKKVRPTELIYMSLEGPTEVVDSLRAARPASSIVTLPSQSSEYSTRTSGHLRTMQNMSYFHLDGPNTDGLQWNATPLTSTPPWQVAYSGEESGVMGVLCYGECPPANLLAEAINGSLVSVVVIDDMLALPSLRNDEIFSEEASSHHTADNDLHVLDDSTFHPANLNQPMIVSTPEGIPYFNPLNSIALDPQYSHSIGLALVRGIDVRRKCLQLITPIPNDIIQQVFEEDKKIVLVSGKLDIPGWAYTEALVQKDIMNKSRVLANEEDAGESGKPDDEEDAVEEEIEGLGKINALGKEFDHVPWVSRVSGSQGRGIGSRVWRVRRDLGKSEGGD